MDYGRVAETEVLIKDTWHIACGQTYPALPPVTRTVLPSRLTFGVGKSTVKCLHRNVHIGTLIPFSKSLALNIVFH
jgi:hypothetical protein